LEQMKMNKILLMIHALAAVVRPTVLDPWLDMIGNGERFNKDSHEVGLN